MNAAKLTGSLAAATILATLVAPVARGQDAPPSPTPPGAGDVRADTPPPSTGEAPGPTPAPSPTPSAAPKDQAASGESGLWLGSKPGSTVEAGIELFVASFKSRSHFGFKETQGRGEETAFVEDAGWPSTVLMQGATIRLDLGIGGWVGADLLGFAVSDEQGFLTRERQTNGVFFEPGDTLHSHGQILWGKVYYGYEFGYRLELGGVPVAFALSPYLGLGAIDVDVRLRRVTATPTNELGGQILAFNVVSGFQGSVDFFDHVKLGTDLGIPEALPLTSPRVHTSDRYGVYLGLHAFHVELDLGWRLVANHLLGIDRAVDMRFRGYDFELRLEF